MKSQSLDKLKAISRFLQISGRYNFQNYNLSLFINFLESDPEFSPIIADLLHNYSFIEKDALATFEKAEIKRFGDFEGWVAFCVWYLKTCGVNNGNKVIDNFIIDTGRKEDNEQLSSKLQFYNDCIEPILIYIELKMKHSLSALSILMKYKILCEWYDRSELYQKTEPEITRVHLAKFLLAEGFTYSFSEISVPSGRIDNFAFNMGIKKEEINRIPSAIVVEGKIFDSASKPLVELTNQIEKRVKELNFLDGYCVIFNKSPKRLRLQYNSKELEITNGSYVHRHYGKRLFFTIINIHDDFYISTKKLGERKIELMEKTELSFNLIQNKSIK